VDTRAQAQALAALLDRHQEWREAGLPAISVLCGATGLSVQRARQWAQDKGRGVAFVQGSDTQLETLVNAWTDALAGTRDLIDDAILWLARRLDQPAEELHHGLRNKTTLERDLFLSVALPEETSVTAACRWLLTQPAGAIRTPGLARGPATAPGGASCEHSLSALCALIPQNTAPILLMVPPTAGWQVPTGVAQAAASLARLAEAEPQVPLFLAIEHDELEHYHTSTPESRAKTLLRAGTLTIPAVDEREIARRLDEAVPGASTMLAPSIRRLAIDAASDRLVELFVEAARATAAVAPETEHDDRARSAAERFLFERLETLPATAGRFTLNARLDFAFGGGRAIEVDLAAAELALALEIDGYYHFRNAEAYRRDRRKDLELQKHSYLVVRVLADDVVRRLEEVLDQVLAAVALRQGHDHQGKGS
jgi:hypothetical protein